ncbi:hypothetical protein [Streptomyces cavernicola]|uniref:IrrE N-terminal-like domain-containing protein n=1 Tax=Streptomyces cavernicola TaxID=3043613 RepID=A0ABT6SEJ7_9ACTN|nr:hypothetical protein [Streptomyces sp. B-S-A6]MDI3406279.1 hypothetical protein [Streptomyces sp. B-S-A6]
MILYQQETTRLHQDHTVLHEVGHILVAENEAANQAQAAMPGVDNPDQAGGFVEGWAHDLPTVTPDAIKRVAQRCSYEDGNECVVELAATIILEWSPLLNDAAPLSKDPSLRRVEAALGDRRGWL